MAEHSNTEPVQRWHPAKLPIDQVVPVTPPFELDNPTPPAPTAMPGTRRWTILKIGGVLTALLLVGGLLAVNRLQQTGSAQERPTTAIAPGPGKSDDIDVSLSHGCAVTARQTVQCWGDNRFGQLGDGTTRSSPTPVDVAGLSKVTGVSVEANVSCALTKGRTVSCWGSNSVRQLGGDEDQYLTPVEIEGLTEVTALSVGRSTTCAVINTGKVKCLGNNGDGQLGVDSDEDFYYAPETVSGIDSATAVSVSAKRICAITSGLVSCWGRLLSGPQGSRSGEPVKLGGVSGVVRIDTSDIGVCAAQSDGYVRCFDYEGPAKRLWPDVEADLIGVTAITSGQNCAIDAEGVTCWRTGRPPVHDEGFEKPSKMVRVPGLRDAVAISSAGKYMCGLLPDYSIQCTGEDSNGQIGGDIFEDVSSSPPSSR